MIKLCIGCITHDTFQFSFIQGGYYPGHPDISDSRLAGTAVPPTLASVHWHCTYCNWFRRICLLRVLQCLERAETQEKTEGDPKKIDTNYIYWIYQL